MAVFSWTLAVRDVHRVAFTCANQSNADWVVFQSAWLTCGVEIHKNCPGASRLDRQFLVGGRLQTMKGRCFKFGVGCNLLRPCVTREIGSHRLARRFGFSKAVCSAVRTAWRICRLRMASRLCPYPAGTALELLGRAQWVNLGPRRLPAFSSGDGIAVADRFFKEIT